MWDQILVAVIVLVAAWYVFRGLRRSLSGKTACQQDYCARCPFADTCGHVQEHPEPQGNHSQEPSGAD